MAGKDQYWRGVWGILTAVKSPGWTAGGFIDQVAKLPDSPRLPERIADGILHRKKPRFRMTVLSLISEHATQQS